MKLVIEVELGNDAMQTAGDAIDSLRRALVAGSASLFDPLQVGELGTVADGNGNTVGRWEVVAS